MKTVIEMAREAGFQDGIAEFIGLPVFERFAELVRDDYSTAHANLWLDRIHKFMLEEREACAQLCEDQWQTAHDIQDAIRARKDNT